MECWNVFGVRMEDSGGDGMRLQLVFVKSIWILLLSLFEEKINEKLK